MIFYPLGVASVAKTLPADNISDCSLLKIMNIVVRSLVFRIVPRTESAGYLSWSSSRIVTVDRWSDRYIIVVRPTLHFIMVPVQ